MFSGIGGFELGIGNNFECVGYSEIDRRAIEIYERHFKHRNFGNADQIIPAELPDFDFLVGGFPCQGFSIAGNRKGFDDTRGTQFFNIARITKEKKPKYLLLENVKGLLSHDNGRTFKTILSTLNELDYDAESMVLDSSDFQGGQRPRLFIFATHRKQENDVRQGAEQTTPLYSRIRKRTRTSNDSISEVGRGSERIIRAFAKLPDWLDSWDSFYSTEESLG